ncbi:uncharacterized protein LOC113315431 [Papaver somniferum]|uniref:uncharacterized protein LOC113315431 n=1 Tax=Papaver somniferum TaxID=3469 RepID=UPI000E6F87F9|nr:uncharacterized protein LOC113315431 [Papaver somniferum]
MVAVFLYVIAHHHKNRVVGFMFKRSGETISIYVNTVLKGVIRLQGELLKQPVAVATSSVDERWNCFKVIYVYPGWEGSAADSRVPREAIYKKNGLEVPQGYYYLVDAGYPNSGGFLVPFRGQRYHLKEWGQGRLEPRTAEELFNMKHCRARNVIERVFGLLKMRWAILRSPSWYPVNIHCRFIMACCLIHNLIRKEMPMDEFLEEDNYEDGTVNLVSPQESRMIEFVDSSDYWAVQRKELADQMKVMAPHRSWVEAKDNVLVDILTELTLDGKWKSDTGFKSGYLKVIEQKLTEKLPTCGLTTTNIDSRIKTLKKHAMAINEMMFSYKCKGTVWESIPHLDALVEIFAKDRANGKGAASLAEELEEIEKEGKQEKEEENDQQQSNQSESNSGKGRRKRVRSSSFDIVSGESSGDSNGLSLMANSFSKFVTGTLDHFEAVRVSLTQEADVNKRLFEELNKIDGLTEDEVIDAASIILDSSTKTKVFFGMGEEKRSNYVKNKILK